MEIVKKIFIVILVLLSAFIGYLALRESSERDKAVFMALDVADVVKGFYKGSNDINKVSSYLTDESKKVLDDYLVNLKDKDNVGFNLSDYYSNTFNNEESTDVADDVLDPVSEEALNYVVDESFLVDESLIVEDLPNDSRIYTVDGKDYIRVKDLEFKDNLTYIDYKNTTLLLSKDDMPLTYSDLIHSSDFKFILKDYSVNKREGCYNIGVEYISLVNSGKLKVNLLVKDRKVKDVKIEVIESRADNE